MVISVQKLYNKGVQAYKRKVRVHYETKQHVSDDFSWRTWQQTP